MPTDFGFPIDVRARPGHGLLRPHPARFGAFPPDGKLRVYRSRTGGNEWEALTKGLPQTRLLCECLA